MPSDPLQQAARMEAGTLSAIDLRHLVRDGIISSDAAITDSQIQPASIDLRLSGEAYRMPGSMLALPGETVRDLVDDLALERVDLSTPHLLVRNAVYLVRLQEHLSLPPGLEAYTNSKSSTGRIDLATRVITDGSPRYDRIKAGYSGDLWLELIPRSFDIVARAGDSLNQAIFFHDRQVLNQSALINRFAESPLLYNDNGAVEADHCLFDGRVVMGADMQSPIVGYVAKRSHRPIDLAQLATHRADDFFQPLSRPSSGFLFLERDRFYILATYERVVVPNDLACEMVPYDPSAGEFRAHYAGFFDPGWGTHDASQPGAKAVLEVRPHEDDLILRHGQPICAMAYEVLTYETDLPYGVNGNNYANQAGPRLSKHFLVDQ